MASSRVEESPVMEQFYQLRGITKKECVRIDLIYIIVWDVNYYSLNNYNVMYNELFYSNTTDVELGWSFPFKSFHGWFTIKFLNLRIRQYFSQWVDQMRSQNE